MTAILQYVQRQTGVRGSLYIIDADHGVKIGISRWPYPQERTLDISRTAGMRMQIIRAWQFPVYAQAQFVEREAHRRLKADRTLGEWFHCHPLEACATVERIVADLNRPLQEAT